MHNFYRLPHWLLTSGWMKWQTSGLVYSSLLHAEYCWSHVSTPKLEVQLYVILCLSPSSFYGYNILCLSCVQLNVSLDTFLWLIFEPWETFPEKSLHVIQSAMIQTSVPWIHVLIQYTRQCTIWNLDVSTNYGIMVIMVTVFIRRIAS